MKIHWLVPEKSIIGPLMLLAAVAVWTPQLAGCTQGGGVASAGDYSAGSAEAAYQGVYHTWALKVANGTMTPARFKELEGIAYAALQSARNAKTVADAVAARSKLDALPQQ